MEQHTLTVFANRVLITIFGPKRDEVKGKWRKLHNVELHKLYYYQNIIRQIKSRRKGGRGIWHAWERRVKCTGFWWKSLKERERPLGRRKRRGEDEIRMDLGDIG
jgi:hypothetical protein